MSTKFSTLIEAAERAVGGSAVSKHAVSTQGMSALTISTRVAPIAVRSGAGLCLAGTGVSGTGAFVGSRGYVAASRLRPVAPINGAAAGTDFGAPQIDPGLRTWSPPV